MGNREIQEEWDQTPYKGILPEGVKSRMWMNIRKETLNRQRLNYGWITVACAVLLVSIIGYQFFFTTDTIAVPAVATNTFSNDVRLLRLPDGTRVWVNQNTHIEYPKEFEGDERKVTLKGEAFFEVAKDPSKPFIITSGNITTTVLGTSFNVKAYEGKSAEVSVRTGKVKVEGQQNTVLLERGYAALYAPDSKLVRRERITQLEPDWKKTLLDIDGLTLEQLMRELSIAHNLTVEYSSNDLKALKIKGTLDTRHGVHEMLQTIAFALDITIIAKSDTTYAISK